MELKLTKKVLIFSLLMFSAVGVFSESLPRGYQKIQLGMTLEQVKEELKNDKTFGYRGERDVSLLPTEERVLIETPGSRFFSRCWFQFYEDKLYSITLKVNVERMDYYSVFKKYSEKYGEPKSINPEKAEWSDDNVIVIIEKPLTLKYLDAGVYNSLIEKGQKLESSESTLREQFLESL